ncbi:OLC1v1001450C1 [Oldenlandia corymbosa var. corymbosa]|uniref:DNA topoisomerase 2 n=1 Tax=Oldenlandia corymbosa var. corymbosa TaxID=529605 RepID=A0AAV1D585_OLDCO|nr:OLC1v1001450C1 [Oldenlandia corymbosa var. corymbosa]
MAAAAGKKSSKLPLQSSNNANIPVLPTGKTIEETYQKKTQLEHILLRPDTYIGSVEAHTQRLWVYENNSLVEREISYVPGLYKIFDEILVNAADNKQRDPKMNSLKVVIDVEENSISVYNNGDGVPVEIHQEEGVYVPELIFGHLLTSSNYDDTQKKTTGGRNGYGAKLTNIFSTEFVIETADGKRQRKYKQVFSNNMGTKSQPIITKCKESENWTKVTFKPDLAKFNMTRLEDDVVALMKKRVVDMAGCLGETVKVELNGQKVPVKSFKDYCNLYLQSARKPGEDPHEIIHEKVNDRWEVVVSLSEGGQFQQVSFVNSIATIKGGTHVDYVTNQIISHIIDTGAKRKKNKFNVKAPAVRNHLWVFVNALIDNPAFDSQTKENLTLKQSNFGSKCSLTDAFLDKVFKKSGVVEKLEEWVNFKLSKDLKKTDGTKKQRITGLAKLTDANDAGGKNSEKCTLILTEGDSAKALALAGISVVGKDHYGVFPLRGKLLNVREASHKQIMENAEIQHIKKILGLQQDKVYDNVKSLRYGHLMIMTDQDHDGSHIKGLLINFIHKFWPSLLKIPSFLVEFITPIVKAFDKKNEDIFVSFYSMPEYEAWKENLGNDAKRWRIKYYKGLGTSDANEGKQYFEDIEKHKKDFIWEDEQDGEAIELAFSKKKIEERKNWLRQFEPGTCLDQKEKLIKYRDFVNKELILFSMADLQRSIPSMVDGLKPGQRKILYCAFKRKNFHIVEAKVAQFAGYVSEHSAYHHGEQSLASTIIGMAQHFVGSNNIEFLQPKGQFGTRNQGGKDAASPRYIFTKLAPITRILFPKDDDGILDYLKEDGQPIEPTWYIPIIPMVLVNGSEGIGTGWSSFIPNYNPRDIIANIRRLLNDESMEPMHPWYRGFSGTIQKTGPTSYTASGVVEEIDGSPGVRVTELPIRKWTQEYKEFLESVMVGSEKTKDQFIEEYRDQSDVTSVYFEIYMSEENLRKAKEEDGGLLKKFKLTTTINTSNMHLFDSRGVIKKYDTPEQILEDFFHLRLEYYDKRKMFLLGKLQMELLKLQNKVRFIREVLEGSIIVSKRRKADLFVELKEKGFTPFPKKKSDEVAVAGETEETEEETEEKSEVDNSKEVGGAGDYDYLLSMSIGTLTEEKYEELCDERKKAQKNLDDLRNTPPKDLWIKDLEALDEQLDAEDEGYYNAKKAGDKMREKAMKGRQAQKAPRKYTKKVSKKEPTAEPMEISENSAMETVGIPEVPKAKGKAGPKKPARKGKSSTVQLKDEEDDDDMPERKDRQEPMEISENSTMETDTVPEVPKGKGKADPKKPARKVRIRTQYA